MTCYWSTLACPTGAADDVQAVSVGQTEVDQQQIICRHLHRQIGVLDGLDPIDRKTLGDQTLANEAAEPGVVLNQEQAHGRCRSPLVRVCSR